jgi:hypothetical protein
MGQQEMALSGELINPALTQGYPGISRDMFSLHGQFLNCPFSEVGSLPTSEQELVPAKVEKSTVHSLTCVKE